MAKRKASRDKGTPSPSDDIFEEIPGLKMLEHPIAFHRAFVAITGSLGAGLMLSQAYYWARHNTNPQGWFYKTQAQWYEETCMERVEQEEARAKLRKTSFWHEKRRGVPARLYFRLNIRALWDVLTQEPSPVSLETVLHEAQTVLRHMSKAGYMRARKAAVKTGAQVEYVDYAEVLGQHGMRCGKCRQSIVRTIMKEHGGLSFDHKISLKQGGAHTLGNIHPVHLECRRRNDRKSQKSEQNASLLTGSRQECFLETDSTASCKQTISETTQETTKRDYQKAHKGDFAQGEQNHRVLATPIQPKGKVKTRWYLKDDESLVDYELVKETINRFYTRYQEAKGRPHPKLKEHQLELIYDSIDTVWDEHDITDEDTARAIVERYWLRGLGKADGNLNAFAHPGMLTQLLREMRIIPED